MYVALALIYIVSFVSGASDFASCNSNTCYQTVNSSHENLLNLIKRFNETASQAKVDKIYDLKNIEKQIKQVKNIENKLKTLNNGLEGDRKKLNQTEVNITKDQKIVDNLLESLANISKYNTTENRILKEAKDNQTYFENLLKLAENASKTCKEAHNDYSKFKEIIDGIVKDYDNVWKDYGDVSKKAKNINKEVSNTFQETVTTKEKFDQLQLPSILVEDYLQDMESKINQSLKVLKENADILKDLLEAARKNWNDQLMIKWEEIVKEIARLQDDVNKMNEDLKKYEDAFIEDNFNPTVDKVSEDLLRQLRERIEDLENKLKLLEFSEEEILLLQDNKDDERYLAEIRRKRKELKEYNDVLDSVPTSEEELKEIKAIIDDLRPRVALYEEWKKLKEELEILRKNRDEIVEIECINGNNTGLLT